jgi:hypothetical protein
MRLLILTMAFLGLALGQAQKPSNVDDVRFYNATCTLTVSGTGKACTIQVAANPGRTVYLQAATISSTAAATITQDKDGGTATATAATAARLNTASAPIATVYTDSDATAGTAATPVPVQASVPISLDMSMTAFRRYVSTVQNFTWRVPNGVTGTVTIGVFWAEK